MDLQKKGRGGEGGILQRNREKSLQKKKKQKKNNNKRVLVIYECKSADFSIVCVKYTVRICQDILNLIQLCSFNNSYGMCYSGEQWGILL